MKLRHVAAILGSLLALGVVAFVSPTVATWVGASGRTFTVAEAPTTDVAIVFGAEVYPSGQPSPYVQGRLDVAIALYRTGRVQRLLMSGDDSAAHHHEPSSMKAYAVKAGIPADRIEVDAHGFDTYDTCVRARRVFGITRATVVSQTYHLPRAITTCRAVGVDAVGVGDSSVKATSARWGEFAARERLANIKMALDLLSGREPRLDR